MLDAILDDALSHPYLPHSTILDNEQFCTIRAPSNPAYRRRLMQALSEAGDLSAVHQRNHQDGLEIIEPVKAGLRGGYWFLRNISHRGDAMPAGDCRYRTMADALDAAIDWWRSDTANRSVVVRQFDLRQEALALTRR